MKKLDVLAALLVIVGGLNWGLVAIAKFDLVETLVGLAAVYGVLQLAGLRQRSSRAPHPTTA